MVATIESFIAETPKDDRRMEFIAIHELHSAVNICVMPIRVVRGPLSGSLLGQLLTLEERHGSLGGVKRCIGNGLETVTFEISFVLYGC